MLPYMYIQFPILEIFNHSKMSQQNHQADENGIVNEMKEMKLKMAILETKMQMMESANGHLVESQIREQKNAKLEDGMGENQVERVGTNLNERTKGGTKLNVAAHEAKWTCIFLCVFLLISILVLQFYFQVENLQGNKIIRQQLRDTNYKLEEIIERNEKKGEELGTEMAPMEEQIQEDKETIINEDQVHLAMTNKQVNNPMGNMWNSTKTKATISANGLEAGEKEDKSVNVYAVKGFDISWPQKNNNFPAGTVVYYYEVKQISYAWIKPIYVGLSNGNISDDSLVGKSPNSYATPLGFDYYLLSGEEHAFEWPNGTEKHAIRDVLGCGLLLSPKNRLSIFFTFNGILLGKQIPINPSGNFLIPTVSIRYVSVEANFGDDQQAKPFKYDIQECPGLEFH